MTETTNRSHKNRIPTTLKTYYSFDGVEGAGGLECLQARVHKRGASVAVSVGLPSRYLHRCRRHSLPRTPRTPTTKSTTHAPKKETDLRQRA